MFFVKAWPKLGSNGTGKSNGVPLASLITTMAVDNSAFLVNLLDSQCSSWSQQHN